MDTVLDQKKYKRLDFSKINFDDEQISTEDSLEDVTPIHWSDDVLNGKRMAVIKRQK